MTHSINLCAEEMAIQVKRHRDKRRKRRESRAAAAGEPPAMEPPGMSAAM
jgi:putative sigma-54 modulation protein